MKLHGKWRRMANNLVKKHNNRRLFVKTRFCRLVVQYQRHLAKQQSFRACTALRRLATKLLARHANQRQFKAHANLGRLARLYLKKSASEGQGLKEKWEGMGIITQSAQLHQQKQEAAVSRYKKRFNKGTAQLSAIERWEMLTALMTQKSNRQKSMKNSVKWRYLANKLLARDARPNNHKRQTVDVAAKEASLENQGKLIRLATKYIRHRRNLKQLQAFIRLRSLARRYVLLKFKQNRMQAQARLSRLARQYLRLTRSQARMRAHARLFRLADRLLSVNDAEYRQAGVQQRWTRMIRKLQVDQGTGLADLRGAILGRSRGKNTETAVRQQIKSKAEHQRIVGRW